ncbi:ABC-type lipoprotein release transport system permease subunit [Methanohalophilus levihalophilus]|uniref:ABC transporter permease n=1 Tax=Methanohalophilus levihalophilus TaxID=1431282 RepID=UPI001AE246E1|nr:ABC transporter permease [Methanohalophilus levihalophilus]MBP2029876.1 ABC-type lipoprotein release transport system permease subunit [Methanohalophilus levihalophilus]
MYEFRIARRHIFSKRRNAAFSVIAVALAITVIVVLMSLMSGFQADLIDKTVENSPHITISPEEDEDFVHLYNHYTKTIEDFPKVVVASPFLSGQVAITYRDDSAGANIYGVIPEAENEVLNLEEDMVEGSFLALSRTNSGVVLGDNLAAKLGASTGDRVDITVPGYIDASLQVIGIINTGTALDESLAYTKLPLLQDLADADGVVSGISVRVSDPYIADDVAKNIENEIGLEATSWIENNSELLELLNTQLAVTWIYYLLIYMTAGFGIANALINIVMEKKSEIGMLMAMGASKRSITLIFVIESSILGGVGLILGILLGYLSILLIGSYEIVLPESEFYFGLETLPLKVDLRNFVYATSFAFVINLLAGIYPARKASNLDPVEAIEGI